MEITEEVLYMTITVTAIVSFAIAYVLHKKNIHLSFL